MKTIWKKQQVFLFMLLFLSSMFLFYEQRTLSQKKKQLKFDIEVLEWNLKDKDSLLSKKQQIYFLQQKHSDLKLQRDLLMNYSLELRRDIDTLEEEIDTIERR